MVIVIGLLSGAGIGLAGERKVQGRFFTGLEYSHKDMEMQTRFTRDISGTVIERSEFDNPYTANAGGIFLGYTLPWKRCYLSTQFFFSKSNGEFELQAGSSGFVNRLNHSWGIDLMPGIYFYKGLSVFGKLGYVRADFDFAKYSPTSTSYAINTGLNGYTLGGGLACDISRQMTVKIGYEQKRYEETNICASTGPMNDHTLIEPRAKTFFMVLQYNFD